MPYEFVEIFKNIKIGDLVRIKSSCIPPCPSHVVPAPPNFLEFILQHGNCFTIRMIQEIDDDSAMIGVEETNGIIEYPQIERYYTSKRVINV